jgi:cell division protein ZapA
MNDRIVRVSVRILEKEYQVACPLEERSDLLDAAEFLNGKMKEIRDTGNIIGADRIAVLAGLNLANELLKIRNKEQPVDGELGNRVRNLREKVESALTRGKQLDL